MRSVVSTAGERLGIDLCTPAAVRLGRSVFGQLPDGPDGSATVHVTVSHRVPTISADRRPLGRGAWVQGSTVLLANLAGSGYLARIDVGEDGLSLACMLAPSPRDRLLALAAQQRARLLRAAALFHYPAMWRAGLRGRAPLHASGLRIDGTDILVTGHGGIGKSTVVAAERRAGAAVASDNLVVTDGERAFGVLEPERVSERVAGARRTTHGRWEHPAAEAGVAELRPTVVVLLRRSGDRVRAHDVSCDEAARALVTSTYAAGELRRYWPLAAALAAGTDRGAAHPPVQDVAEQLCATATCVVLDVGSTPGAHLSAFLRAEGVLRCE
jgi:hypothetical protein